MRAVLIVLVSSVWLSLVGCQVLVSNVTTQLADDFSRAIMNSEDLDVVKDGLPAFLLLVEALLEGNDSDVGLLTSASLLNSAYSAAFVTEPVRQKQFADKSKALALKASCLDTQKTCGIESMPFDEAETVIASLRPRTIDSTFVLLVAWANWLEVNSSDFRALTQLPKVSLLVDKMLDLDESYQLGSPHLYKAVFESLVPASMGGNPELAREHFERAIELSEGKNLYAQVLFAQYYARMTLNRELHDDLLDEVLNADPVFEGYTLQNRIAQDLAQKLKDDADDYF